MTRRRAAAHAAFITIDWTVAPDGRYSVATEQLIAALEHAYALGYKHARADAAQAVGQLLGEHELILEEDKQ